MGFIVMKNSVDNGYRLLNSLSRFNPVYNHHYGRFVQLLHEALDTDKDNCDYYNKIQNELQKASLKTSVEEIRTMCNIVTTFKYYDINVSLDYYIQFRNLLSAVYKRLGSSHKGIGNVKETFLQLENYRNEGFEFYWDRLVYVLFSLYCNRKYGAKKIGRGDFSIIKKELEQASELRVRLLGKFQFNDVNSECYDINKLENWEEFINWAFVQTLGKGLSEDSVFEKMCDLGIICDNDAMQVLNYTGLFNIVSSYMHQGTILDIIPFIIDNPDCIEYLEDDIIVLVKEKIQQIFSYITDDIIFSYALCNVWERINTSNNKEFIEGEIAKTATFLNNNSLVPLGSEINYNYIKRFVNG